MPAEVETMAYAKRNERDIPWHQLGTPIVIGEGDKLPDGATMQEAASLTWGVHKQPLFTVAIDNPAQYIAVNSRVAIVLANFML